MANKQWLEQWLVKESFTKDDVMNIVGRRPIMEDGGSYTKRDILRILGPSDSPWAAYRD